MREHLDENDSPIIVLLEFLLIESFHLGLFKKNIFLLNELFLEEIFDVVLIDLNIRLLIELILLFLSKKLN